MMLRWKMRKNTIVGTAAIADAAMIRFVRSRWSIGDPAKPCRPSDPAGAGRCAGGGASTTAANRSAGVAPVINTETSATSFVKPDAEIADTPLLIERGLGGRSTLDDGTGMLFVFASQGSWGLWMKDMHFAVDMIWIDTSGVAVTILKHVGPASFPQIFYPSHPARYALETSAGFVAAHSIAEGMSVVIP